MALTKADIAEHLFEKLGINKKDAKDLVEAFFEEIRSALEKGDHEATRFVSHSIKGNAGDVGAVAVHKMAAELEKLAKAQNLDDINAVMPLFTATVSATLAAMGEE